VIRRCGPKQGGSVRLDYNHAIGPDGAVWVLAGADHWEEEDPPVDA
jgi:hypothetical protein